MSVPRHPSSAIRVYPTGWLRHSRMTIRRCGTPLRKGGVAAGGSAARSGVALRARRHIARSRRSLRDGGAGAARRLEVGAGPRKDARHDSNSHDRVRRIHGASNRRRLASAAFTSPTCPSCAGAKKVRSTACAGTGSALGGACNGERKAYGHSANGAYRLLNCTTCRGNGQIDCVGCRRSCRGAVPGRCITTRRPAVSCRIFLPATSTRKISSSSGISCRSTNATRRPGVGFVKNQYALSRSREADYVSWPISTMATSSRSSRPASCARSIAARRGTTSSS